MVLVNVCRARSDAGPTCVIKGRSLKDNAGASPLYIPKMTTCSSPVLMLSGVNNYLKSLTEVGNYK